MADRSYRAVLWLLALMGLVMDQGSKYAVFNWLSGGEGRAHILFGSDDSGLKLIAQYEPDGIDGWKPHVNHGALFGMGGAGRATANGFSFTIQREGLVTR